MDLPNIGSFIDATNNLILSEDWNKYVIAASPINIEKLVSTPLTYKTLTLEFHRIGEPGKATMCYTTTKPRGELINFMIRNTIGPNKHVLFEVIPDCTNLVVHLGGAGQ